MNFRCFTERMTFNVVRNFLLHGECDLDETAEKSYKERLSAIEKKIEDFCAELIPDAEKCYDAVDYLYQQI